MPKYYINTVSRTFFNHKGAPLAEGDPRLAYKRKEEIIFQLCTDTTGAGTSGVDPENWPKDTSFGESGTSALLSLDKDFLRRRKGTIAASVPGGAVQTIRVYLKNAVISDIAPTGVMRIFSSNGETALSYISVTKEQDIFVFSLDQNTTLSFQIPEGSTVDIPDALFAQAVMDDSKSVPAQGLFAFDLFTYSAKLRDAMEYENVAELRSLVGMELLIFHVSGEDVKIVDNFLCSTVSLHGTVAEANSTPDLPDSQKDALVALISAEIQRQLADWDNPGGGGGAGGGSTNAADIIISSESQYYAGMDVASALQAIGAELDGLEESLSSIATDMEAI